MRITTVVEPPIHSAHFRGIVFVMGISLVFWALQTSTSAKAAETIPTTQPDVVDAQDVVPPVGKPAADPPMAVSAVIPPLEGEVATPPAAKPAAVPAVETQRAEVIPPPVPHGHVAAADSMPSPAPAVAGATVPPVRVKPVPVSPVHIVPVPVPPVHVSHAPVSVTPVTDPPVINSVQNFGTSIHIAWRPLGAGVTYKVYAMPDVQKKSFEFRFPMYGTDLQWVLHENKAWRYVAVTAVNRNGDETPLSNIVDTKHPVLLTPPPPPPVLGTPVIDTVENLGPFVHLAWKSLGSGVTYKVYAMPNASRPSFQFRFNLYGTDLQWSLGDNTAWRYVAVTAVDKNGKESPLSNIVDTTPGLPKP